MDKREDLLIWVDLETTGLDCSSNMNGVHNHKIIEVGVMITDIDYNPVDEGFEIIIHHSLDTLNSCMNDFVKNMHTVSGLIDKSVNSPFSLKMAEQMILDYIDKYNIKHGVSPICGNNVGFDKNFIDAQMPNLSKAFHYRKIDVSSIKEIAWRKYPEIAGLVNKQMKHRGLDDIKESIEELKIYESKMFIKPEVSNKKKLKP